MKYSQFFWVLFVVCLGTLYCRAADLWTPIGSIRGTDNDVLAITRLNTGQLIVGGLFTNAGSVRANHVAIFNGSTWLAMGNGFTSAVYALASDGTISNIYAGGEFGFRRWNGTAWVNVGTHEFRRVYAIDVLAPNDILIGGDFNTNGLARIARWNGVTWLPLGTGLNGPVYSIARDYFSGNALVGGKFTTAGGVPARNVALWRHAFLSWTNLGLGLEGGGDVVRQVAIDGLGVMYAAGDFTYSGPGTNFPVSRIARWTGSAWQQIGSNGLPAAVYALQVVLSNNVYAGGVFSNYVLRWNGSTWTNLGGGVNYHCRALYLHGLSVLHAGGAFWSAGGRPVSHVATWNGMSWTNLGEGFRVFNETRATALASGPGGDYIAIRNYQYTFPAGWLTDIYRWNGVHWQPVAAGILGEVNALAVTTGGWLYAGGYFTNVQGIAARNIALWNGTTWTNLGLGLNDTVRALNTRFAGNGAFAGGDFTTSDGFTSLLRGARWDGSSWVALGDGFNGPVHAMEWHFPSATFFVGGSFTQSGTNSIPRIALAGMSGWEPVGSGISNGVVRKIISDLAGKLYVIGNFTNAGGIATTNIAMWNGSNWSALPVTVSGATNHDIAVDSNGRLVAVGTFTNMGGATSRNIAAWNGAEWSPISGGLNGPGWAICSRASDGRLLVAGSFSEAGGLVSPLVALLESRLPVITSIVRTASGVVLHWSPISTGYVYHVLYSSTWYPTSVSLLAWGISSGSATDSTYSTSPTRFYIVQEEPEY